MITIIISSFGSLREKFFITFLSGDHCIIIPPVVSDNPQYITVVCDDPVVSSF